MITLTVNGSRRTFDGDPTMPLLWFLRDELCPALAHARIGWYRSVNAVHHGFAIGSFVDELAHASDVIPSGPSST